ncbi:MAG: nuclear transport factor 2 family protein [Clostridia bacterium]|nr:nuclear transport factor 2 family protein [Clostridia bacterium]
MRMQDVADQTMEIITRYYQNDIQPFLDLCHEDVLWIGPAEGQVIRTRQALLDAFRAEKQTLRFAVSDMTVVPVPIGSTKVFNVMAMYTVDTFWPDGSTNRVHQRCSITWSMQEDRPSIRLCHLSNAIAYDVQDVIYPTNYSKTFVQPAASQPPPGRGHECRKAFLPGGGQVHVLPELGADHLRGKRGQPCADSHR